MGGKSTHKRRSEERDFIFRQAARLRKGILTGPAAARVRGISTYTWVAQVDVVYLSKSRSRERPSSELAVVQRNGAVSAQDCTVYNGVRVTSLIRTLFDSYRYHGRLEALVQIESARWKWPELTVDELLERTETMPRAKGLKGFRELIKYSADTSASALETLGRDWLMQAIRTGQLTGVETIEFQVGFRIRNRFGEITTAWADVLINGFLFTEIDGAEKTSGEIGDAVEAVNNERHREKQLQNEGAVFQRVGWNDVGKLEVLAQLQRHIDNNPGVKQLPNRLEVTYREWRERGRWRRAG